jgi:hypothetical protein
MIPNRTTASAHPEMRSLLAPRRNLNDPSLRQAGDVKGARMERVATVGLSRYDRGNVDGQGQASLARTQYRPRKGTVRALLLSSSVILHRIKYFKEITCMLNSTKLNRRTGTDTEPRHNFIFGHKQY